MLLLLACAGNAPKLVLPAAPPAENAESLPLQTLLTPTPFGASDDVLCLWARGEPGAAASIPRWLAEGRLTWRILRPDEPATFAGLPLSESGVVIAAAEALEARCHVEPRPRTYLIAASGDTSSGAVLKGMHELGKRQFEVPWLLVTDATPVAASPSRAASDPPAPLPDTTPSRSRLLDLLAGEGAAPAPASPEFFTIVVQDPPSVISSNGEIHEPWLQWLQRSRPTELLVAPPDRAPWANAVKVIDAARGVGAHVVLAMRVEETDGSGAEHRSTTAGLNKQDPSAEIGWDGSLPVLPIAVPRYR